MKYVLLVSFAFLNGGLSYAQQSDPTGGSHNYCSGHILNITPTTFPDNVVLENGKDYAITVDLSCSENSNVDIIIELDWRNIVKISGPHAAIVTIPFKLNMLPGYRTLYYNFKGFSYMGYKDYNLDTLKVLIAGTNGVEDVQEEKGISVYPIPANTELNITTENNLNGIEKVSIHDLQGKEMLTLHQSANNSKMTIPVDELANGTYILQLRTNNGNFNKRIAVMH
ncbi:MAG: Secretion system C-terminal sorting domain [Flavipsychrobacter sp.]|jgi:hypothetical protein|nr:Secretion system C-terminal sorting domain [Flavipsychrobacter sp.]